MRHVYSNKESLEVIKYFLSLVDITEDNKMFWKLRNGLTDGDARFNGRYAGKELTRETVSVTYKDIYYCFSRKTVDYVLKHGKLPINVNCGIHAIYPNTEEGLHVYNEFLKSVRYSDEDKCFYWLHRDGSDKGSKVFNKLYAGKRVGRTNKNRYRGEYINFSKNDFVYSIHTLHALWMLKKGTPSELPLYFIDINGGFSIENISNE